MKHLWKALMMVRRCDPRSFWLRIVYVLLQSLLPLANLYILKMLVDGVTAAVATATFDDHLPILLAAFVGIFLLNRIIAALSAVNSDVLGQRLVDYTSALMQEHAASLDLGYYDTPSFHDTLHRAQQEANLRPIQILNSFMELGGAAVSLVGIVAILAASSPWVVPVMLLAVVPAFLVRLYKARSIYRFRRSSTQLYRQTAYYGSVLTTRTYAAEVRAFRTAGHFRRLFAERRRQLAGRLLRISRRRGVLDVLCAFVEAAALLAVVWMLIHQALTAAISIGTFVMLFEAFRRGQAQLTALAASVAALYDNRLFAANLFEFLDLHPQITAPAEPLAVPDVIESIELRDVTFRYPGADRNALSHFSLCCRRGEVTALEGQNGCGKTTALRLMLRLYDPAEGQVLLNGIDIRRFRPDELRTRIGVLFQDFARYAATVEENLDYGNSQPTKDRSSLDGLLDFVHRLPQGYDTPLTRLFDGGQELSMGQWQRLALARAMAGDAPVMLLDEPMAWMDQPTREAFLARLDELKKNRIIVLVNHI